MIFYMFIYYGDMKKTNALQLDLKIDKYYKF